MQPGPAATAVQVTSCGMGAKTAPRGADHLVRRGTTAPCRTGARTQSGGSARVTAWPPGHPLQRWSPPRACDERCTLAAWMSEADRATRAQAGGPLGRRHVRAFLEHDGLHKYPGHASSGTGFHVQPVIRRSPLLIQPGVAPVRVSWGCWKVTAIFDTIRGMELAPLPGAMVPDVG